MLLNIKDLFLLLQKNLDEVKYMHIMSDFLRTINSTSTTLTPLSCHKLRGMPLGDRGIFQKIEIHHIQVPKGDSSITLNVQDYI